MNLSYVKEMEDGSAIYTFEFDSETETRAFTEIGIKCAIACGIANVSVDELIADIVGRARKLQDEVDEVVKNESERVGDTDSGN